MTAEERGWGPPPAPRSAIVDVASPSGVACVPGVRQGIVEVVATLLAATEQRGYALQDGACWGYAPRKISGSTSWSNHAWGLAVDLNAPNNPMRSPLTTDMPDWMPAMWRDCGFRWGGDYTGTPDPMHYEYMGTPDEVAGDLARAGSYLDREDDTVKRGDESAAVTWWQWRINEYLHDGNREPAEGIATDGVFGAETERAVKEVQGDWGWPQSGQIDVSTAARLTMHAYQRAS
jgi:peptidoglycan hydrolase-like protein with peptidoglycan-binding domain